MRRALVALLVILALAFPVPASAATDLQSSIRAARGDSLPVLPLLQRVAEERAGEIVQDFSHYGPGAAATRAQLAGWSWGEIIAWNNYPPDLTVSSAVQQWLLSAGHASVMLGHWAGFGAAVAVAPDGAHYYAAIFGTPPLPVPVVHPIVVHPHPSPSHPHPSPVPPAPYWPTPAARWRMMPV